MAGGPNVNLRAKRRRQRQPAASEDSDSSSGSGGSGADEAAAAAGGGGAPPPAKLPRVTGRGVGSDANLSGGAGRADKGAFAFRSSRQVQQRTDGGATRLFDDQEERAQGRGAGPAAGPAAGAEAAEGGPAEYTGAANYTDFRAGFKKPDQKPGNKYGPMKATAAIRWSVRVDYQPDVCKDYKETGFCGWGDACKFLHDRGDYKAGWQLDKEWEAKEKLRRQEAAAKAMLGEAEEAKEADDGLPFACFICRKPFTDPVVTQCKHYFCERCALDRNRKHKTCAACGKPTKGIFNVAHEIVRKLKKMKAEGKLDGAAAKEGAAAAGGAGPPAEEPIEFPPVPEPGATIEQVSEADLPGHELPEPPDLR